MTQVESQLRDRLQQSFDPHYMELTNESQQHAGYFSGKESHFKLTIVSEMFEDMRLVKRHQQIYQLAAGFLTSGGGSIHALAIHAYTPQEWQKQEHAPQSPVCASQKNAS